MLTSMPQKTGWKPVPCFREDQYIDKFKHTLNHLARECYHSLDRDTFHGDWEEFTKHFSRYFSTQGQNIKHLHERWRAFSFDPANDNIEEYIRDVKEAAKQLGHGDDAVVNLLKATMLTKLYGTLYSHNNLPLLCTMLKDIYAKKPQPTHCHIHHHHHPRFYSPIHSFKDSPQDPN